MWNRTNRTNSANSNRLNLGTRSLAPVAASTFGPQTLRLRHTHPQKRIDSLRDGDVVGIMYPPLIGTMMPKAKSPSSTPATRWPDRARWSGSRVEVVAEAPPEKRPVIVIDDWGGRSGRSQGRARWQAPTRSEAPVATWPARASASCRACQGPNLAAAMDRTALVPVALSATGG